MQDLHELRDLLDTQAKHGSYQAIPPAILDIDPSLSVCSNSKRLDSQRFNWFSGKIVFKNKTVLDIGANIGYFSLRLAGEKGASIIAYEPFEQHAKAITICKTILGLEDSQFTCFQEGISLHKIDELEQCDVILLLNVLQHAGEDFDRDSIDNIDDWREYALQYLSKLRGVGSYLIFQIGYTWLGHDQKLCRDQDIIDFSIRLIQNSGWNIEYCGVVEDLFNPHYINYGIKYNGHNKPINIELWRKLMIIIMDKIFKQNLDYRFMQRPIFICKR